MGRSRIRPSRRVNGYVAIPEACVGRLSLYVRELSRLAADKATFISSRNLAEQLGLTDAQVRRDLSYFGQFGTSGRGYEVVRLRGRLLRILGVDGHTWNVILVGVGSLGAALLTYRGFQEGGFLFRCAAESDPEKIGRIVRGLRVEPSDRLGALVRRYEIHIGVIAVPVEAAQEVCDQLVEAGVRGIVNFAPVRLDVPSGVRLRTVDLAVELETLAFYMARASRTPRQRLKRMRTRVLSDLLGAANGNGRSRTREKVGK